jgi:type II secretory pathway component PulJ
MVAVSITAVIGLSVAGLAVSLSHAQTRSDVMNDCIQSARTAMLGMEATIRRARLLTGADETRAVAWLGDANEDAAINLNELVLTHYRSGPGTIEQWQVVFPDGMSPEMLAALNVARPLNEAGDIDGVLGLMSQPLYCDYLSQRVLATNVVDFRLATDAAAPLARLAMLRLTVGPADQRMKLTNAVRLRADAVECVEMIGDEPVLHLD